MLPTTALLLMPALLALASCASTPVAVSCPKPTLALHPELVTSPPKVQATIRLELSSAPQQKPTLK